MSGATQSRPPLLVPAPRTAIGLACAVVWAAEVVGAGVVGDLTIGDGALPLLIALCATYLAWKMPVAGVVLTFPAALAWGAGAFLGATLVGGNLFWGLVAALVAFGAGWRVNYGATKWLSGHQIA